MHRGEASGGGEPQAPRTLLMCREESHPKRRGAGECHRFRNTSPLPRDHAAQSAAAFLQRGFSIQSIGQSVERRAEFGKGAAKTVTSNAPIGSEKEGVCALASLAEPPNDCDVWRAGDASPWEEAGDGGGPKVMLDARCGA